MTLRDIALLNLRRRKAKAAFVLAGLLIGVATVVGLVTLGRVLGADVGHKLEKYGANILVLPKTESLSLTYEGMHLGGFSFEMKELRQADLARLGRIRNAANVAAVGPMVLGAVEVKGGRVLLAGVDFASAAVLRPWWRVEGRGFGGPLSRAAKGGPDNPGRAEPPPAQGLLAGFEAARSLGLSKGAEVEIKGLRMTVAGILEPTGSQDDQLLFTHLAAAQTILGKEGLVSMVEVAALCSDCPIEEMAGQIREALPGAKVMAIQQVVKGRMEALSLFRRSSYLVSLVVALVGGLVVLTTMMGSVRERNSEIGILRAIGFRRSHIVKIILLEAGMVSAGAGLIGYWLGLGAARAALPLVSESHPAAWGFDPLLAGASLVLALVLGLAAAAYPALLAARMDPNEALRAL